MPAQKARTDARSKSTSSPPGYTVPLVAKTIEGWPGLGIRAKSGGQAWPDEFLVMFKERSVKIMGGLCKKSLDIVPL